VAALLRLDARHRRKPVRPTTIVLLIATHAQRGFMVDHFGSWAKELTWQRGRYGYGGSYRANGDRYVVLFGLIAVVSIWTAIQMFLKLPLSRADRRRSDDLF
jgi:hypothetical protein